ncbi:outer membrane protein assembly factor BamB [Ottowia sp.]|jgi:outer membrane assembly lipoprotein YfgL|uniref:outer membrane protein assembly factor BamB n=1 Tax=Ottowia sp. TaxID=1898956 RepID=UPI0025EAF539|nr:outer membrane protein assembly factor BamB [Ottowia sp.]MBK6613912.1 outer membrane protein assembly factor BamB [Ottowia sp.]MBK6745526.1 outer membrane protein assembly factor BamB [Ottowia sp.]
MMRRAFPSRPAVLALAMAAVLAGCAGGSARPTPAELPPNVALVAVRQAWAVRLPAVSFPLQVHAQGTQVVVAASDGTVVTLDAVSGRELGRASAGAELSAGVGSDGRITAVVTRANQVVALEGGRELWRQRLPTQSYTAPLVAGGRVFVLGADRSLTALDGRSGARLWKLQRPAEPLVLRQAGVLLPVGNTLVAGMAGRLIGIDPDDGGVRWEAPVASARGTNDVERLVDLVGGFSRQGDTVCVRAFQAAVGCVDASNGNLRWARPANGATGVHGDDQRLYGAESDGRVLAWRADTGERAWASERLQWRHLTGPLVLGRSVIVGDSTGLVHMLSREGGSPLNRFSTDGSGIAATPVAAGNTLVVVTRAGGVFGYVPD